MNLKVHYDGDADVLYLARGGLEVTTEEVSPGITLEFDKQGQLIGVEILRASQVLGDVLEPLGRKSAKK